VLGKFSGSLGGEKISEIESGPLNDVLSEVEKVTSLLRRNLNISGSE
jgi:hypothetical protein